MFWKLSDLPSKRAEERPRSAEIDQQATIAAAAQAGECNHLRCD